MLFAAQVRDREGVTAYGSGVLDVKLSSQHNALEYWTSFTVGVSKHEIIKMQWQIWSEQYCLPLLDTALHMILIMKYTIRSNA